MTEKRTIYYRAVNITEIEEAEVASFYLDYVEENPKSEADLEELGQEVLLIFSEKHEVPHNWPNDEFEIEMFFNKDEKPFAKVTVELARSWEFTHEYVTALDFERTPQERKTYVFSLTRIPEGAKLPRPRPDEFLARKDYNRALVDIKKRENEAWHRSTIEAIKDLGFGIDFPRDEVPLLLNWGAELTEEEAEVLSNVPGVEIVTEDVPLYLID